MDNQQRFWGPDVLSVKHFGAFGDGVHDDTKAFQDAINFGIANRKAIYVPSGQYVIDSLVAEIPRDFNTFGKFTLYGESSDLSILRQTNMMHDSMSSMSRDPILTIRPIGDDNDPLLSASCISLFGAPGFRIKDGVYGDGLYTQHTTYGALHALWGHYQQDEAYVDCDAVYPYHVPPLKATSFHDVGDPKGWTTFADKYLIATAPNLISDFFPHQSGCPCIYETIGN